MPRRLCILACALIVVLAASGADPAASSAPAATSTTTLVVPEPPIPSASSVPSAAAPAPPAQPPAFLNRMLRDYGYLAIVIGTFFEGETIVILAGIAAQQGIGGLNVWWVALAAFAGGLSGDTCWFMIGRRWGARLLARKPKWKERADKVLHHVYRHRVLFVLSFRFFYGLRNVTPFALATTPMPMWYFSVLNALGAAVWALSFAWGGYVIGHAAETYLHTGGFVLLGLLVVAVLAAVWWRRRARPAAVTSIPTPAVPQDEPPPVA